MKTLLLSLLTVLFLLFTEIVPTFAQATMETGSMGITVNAYGRIRAYLPDAAAGVKQIERISALVGIGSEAVYDYQLDGEAEDPTVLVSNPGYGDFEIYGSYNNAYSSNPPDVLVKYNLYSWSNATYALIKFTIVNREASAIDAKIGLDVIMSLDGAYGYDTVSYDENDQIIRTHRGGVNSGIKFLSHPLQSLYSFEWYDAYYVDSSYWNWLNYGSLQTEYIGDVEGPVTIPSIDFININSEDSVIVYFAIGLGENEQALTAAIMEAENKYNILTDVQSDLNNIPSNFTLDQNYPNPFNPATKISFGLPQRSSVVLKVFNTLGQEVAELVNESLEAGIHSFNFDASKLTSGVYIYSLKTDAGVISKKMTLIK